MRKLTNLFFCLFISIGFTVAQTSRVTGTVISSEDGLPVIGASVVVKGYPSVGTATDAGGKFTLNLPAGATTIVVSYVGMTMKELTADTQNPMTVILSSDLVLDEIVVTAMGLTREKKSLGYAVQEVKAGELTGAGQLNLSSSLTGKIAGVQVNQFGGTVGASSRITIRGNSSFSADQQPLLVVDGVPIANDTQRTGDNYYNGVDYGSGINDINPEDIESITVLKGGSAALYGMRAGRGVILITTKKGKDAKGVNISYDGNMTFSNVANIPKLQNLYGQGYAGDEIHWKLEGGGMSYPDYASGLFDFNTGSNVTDESWGPRLDIGLKFPQYDSPVVNGVYQPTPWVSHPNNVRDFFRTGSAMNHTVSVNSQSEQATTRASLSVRKELGTVPNTDQTRYSGQFNTLMNLNKYVRFEMMANYTHTHSDNLNQQGYDDGSPINQLVSWSGRQINMKALKQNWDQRDAAGNYTYYNWIDRYHMNPYFIVNKNTNSLDRDRLFGKSSLYYQPFTFLTFEGRVGFDYYQMKTLQRIYFHWNSPEGSFDQRNSKFFDLNLDLLANFNKTFGDFNVHAVVGANLRDVKSESNRLSANALTILGVYTISNAKGAPVTGMGLSHVRSNSVFGSASIGWRSQLYLDVSGRNDWSSTILDPFFYPGASISWIPTESFGFLKNDVLSYLKLRFGLAEIGAATSAYRNRAYYYAETNAFNGVAQTYRSMTMPTAHLRPEKIVTWEPGIEAGFFDDRLHADVTYYKKVTSDQIMTVSTSNTIGFTSFLINAGRIESQGLEVQLRANILRKNAGLNWTSTLNYSNNKSKVIELAPKYPDLRFVSLGWTWGINNYAIAGEEWGVLYQNGYDRVTQEDIDNGSVGSGAKLNDIKVTSAGLVRSKANQIIGHVSPKFLAGWRNDFTWNNFSAGFFLDFRLGGDIWSQSMSHSYGAGTSIVTVEGGIREKMILPGRDVMKDERFVMQDASGKWIPNTIEVTAYNWFAHGGVTEMYVFDGSFLKLREAYLSYTVPSKILAKTKFISKANVSIVGSNLLLMWVHKSNTMRIDPETGGVSSDTRGIGYEQSAVPNSRNYGIKLGITF